MKNELQVQTNVITERLNLSIITLEDHAFVQALVNTKGWIENIGDRNIHSTEDAMAYINKILTAENLFYWVVTTKENIPIGIISFLKRNYLEHFDIGFAFLPDFNGKGYAFEAANAILSMVSKQGFNKVLATTIPTNTSSIKLLKKLGFSFEKEIEMGKEKLHVYTSKISINP